MRVALLLFAGMLSLPAQAQPQIRELPRAVLEAAPALRPAGQGSFRWFGLLIYDAALWTQPAGGMGGAAVPEGSGAEAPRAWTPARAAALSLRYARELRGQDIAQRSIEEIEQLGMGNAEQRTRWLAAMRALFPDVKRGSVLTGLHLPGRGARFFSDGERLGDIDDEAFSRAFFSIWLDERSSAPALRAALLGERAP